MTEKQPLPPAPVHPKNRPKVAALNKKSAMKSIAECQAELTAKAAQAREREEVQKLQEPLPSWPEDRRGAPSNILRSSVFAALGKGKRERVAAMPIAGPAGFDITLTGFRLDQDDLDIWLEIMHRARGAALGGEIRFTIREFLTAIGRPASKHEYEWLKSRLDGLVETSIAYRSDDARLLGNLGSMIASFRLDTITGMGVVKTNSDMRQLWDCTTFIDSAIRASLGSQIARAVHGIISTHMDWMPMRLDTLMSRIGAEYAELRFFKRDLKKVLDRFVAEKIIKSYKIEKSDHGDIVSVDLLGTPSQIKALAKRHIKQILD